MKYGSEVEKKIYDQKLVLTPTLNASVEKFRNEDNLALYWTQDGVTSAFGSSLCLYNIIPQFTVLVPNVMYVKKNWPYTQLMNYQ